MTEQKTNDNRRDDAEDPKDTKRRKFLVATAAGVGIAWVGAAAYPVYKYLAPRPAPDPFGKDGKAPVVKITAQDVARPGTGKNGGYAGRGLIVLRKEDGTLKAFDSKCQHAGCNVQYEGDKLFCHCHGGTYNLDGVNIAGPPPRPLVELKVFEEDGLLFVSRLEKTS